MSAPRTAEVTATGRTPRRWRWQAASLGSRFVMSSWLIVAFGVGWEIWARWADSLFIPTMGTILSTFTDIWLSNDATQLFLSDQFWTDASASLTRAGLGWFFAAAAGIVGGVILGVWRQAAWFFDPIVRFGVSTPSTIFLPVAILIFGITSAMNIFLIAFGAVWVILINTLDGVRSLDRTTVLTARSLRLGRVRYLFKIVVPGASPQIFTGLRVSIGIALILMIVAELFAASEGLGFFISFSQRRFNYPNMWAGILLVGLIGIAANTLFAIVEARVLRWHRGAFGRDE
ncbi:MAG: ABC transporter permease [Acidimicrobiaceae bacterium]|nr:ABC transporter permease [Acidimicrobiaceae bacterium]MYE65911.1 ABC transporter permease [Acidimicrobiaceae bacterium]